MTFSKKYSPMLSVFMLMTVVFVQVTVSAEEASSSEPAMQEYEEGCICYLLYEPVCASDGKTYSNSCHLNCARRRDPYLIGICKGECPCCKEPYFNEMITEPWPGYGWGPFYFGPPAPSQASSGWKKAEKPTGNKKV